MTDEKALSEWRKRKANEVAGYRIGAGMNKAGGTFEQDGRYIAFKAGLAAGEELGRLLGRIAALEEAFVFRRGAGRPEDQKPWQQLLAESEAELARLIGAEGEEP